MDEKNSTFEDRMELDRKRRMFQLFSIHKDLWYADPITFVASSLVFYRKTDCTDAELADHICTSLHFYMKSHNLCIVPFSPVKHAPYALGLAFKNIEDVAKKKP